MISIKFFGLLFVLINITTALYENDADVVQLSSANFDRLVTDSDNVWIVQFYANWCGYSKRLVPEYKKAAKALKGVVKVGAVDCDESKDLADKYDIEGFPTLKIFTGKDSTLYEGERTAKEIAEAGLAAASKNVIESSGKSSGICRRPYKSLIVVFLFMMFLHLFVM